MLSLLLARASAPTLFLSIHSLSSSFPLRRWKSLKITLKVLLVCGCVCICAQIFLCMLRHLQRPGIGSPIPWNWSGSQLWVTGRECWELHCVAELSLYRIGRRACFGGLSSLLRTVPRQVVLSHVRKLAEFQSERARE